MIGHVCIDCLRQCFFIAWISIKFFWKVLKKSLLKNRSIDLWLIEYRHYIIITNIVITINILIHNVINCVIIENCGKFQVHMIPLEILWIFITWTKIFKTVLLLELYLKKLFTKKKKIYIRKSAIITNTYIWWFLSSHPKFQKVLYL